MSSSHGIEPKITVAVRTLLAAGHTITGTDRQPRHVEILGSTLLSVASFERVVLDQRQVCKILVCAVMATMFCHGPYPFDGRLRI